MREPLSRRCSSMAEGLPDGWSWFTATESDSLITVELTGPKHPDGRFPVYIGRGQDVMSAFADALASEESYLLRSWWLEEMKPDEMN